MKRFRPNKLTTAIIIALIFSIFMACGSSAGVLTHRKTVTREKIHEMCPQGKHDSGCAVLHTNDASKPYIECDIYLLPMDEYPSMGEFYYTWGHESRHCHEGQFHK